MKKIYGLTICVGVITVFFLCYNNFELLDKEKIPTIQESEEQDNTSSNDVLIKQIKNGDFSNLKSDITEEIQRVYTKENESQNIEWREYDLNGDGISELIWQNAVNYNKNMKSIVGIFTFQNGNAKCITWDINDSTEYLFLSETGNIIHYTQYYGLYMFNGFDYYIFDNEWNRKFDYGLYIYYIYDFSEVSDESWYQKHPDMIGEGVYYTKCTVRFAEEEVLEEKQFMEAFKEIVGPSPDLFLPEWFFD